MFGFASFPESNRVQQLWSAGCGAVVTRWSIVFTVRQLLKATGPPCSPFPLQWIAGLRFLGVR
jgi:hypothetical protein